MLIGIKSVQLIMRACLMGLSEFILTTYELSGLCTDFVTFIKHKLRIISKQWERRKIV
jgi:hypothetical protein